MSHSIVYSRVIFFANLALINYNYFVAFSLVYKMFNYPRLVLKVGVLTLLFLIGFFFIFPPERPLTHLHDHEKEPHEPHTRISQDVQQDTTVIPDENGVVEEYFQEYMREEE